MYEDKGDGELQQKGINERERQMSGRQGGQKKDKQRLSSVTTRGRRRASTSVTKQWLRNERRSNRKTLKQTGGQKMNSWDYSPTRKGGGRRRVSRAIRKQ